MSVLDTIQNIHVVGIKGAGTSALARILKARGKRVCGSDVDEVFFTDEVLHDAGIPLEHFSSDHIVNDSLDCIIYSSAWKDSEEVVQGKARGLMTMSYAEALGDVLNSMKGIAVAGSHGKTTSTAMLAYVLKEAGLDPTAVIGSALSSTHSNTFLGSSDLMVIEADEYENKFIYYRPFALLLTNIDYDHPDYFVDEGAYEAVFRDFVLDVIGRGGTVVACKDDKGIRRALSTIPSSSILWYGSLSDSTYRLVHSEIRDRTMVYSVAKNESVLGPFTLPLFGKHNVYNALGVLALCDTLGLVPVSDAARILESFRGTARRFEYKGSRGSMRIYDDFAHHPTEIQATLTAARELYPKARIWCVFGSHTFTRTKALLSDFSRSFHEVDRVLILDIYGSAREDQGGIHGRDLAYAIDAVSSNAM